MISNGSQYGQDRLVLQVLDGLRGGYFLDSGASDGIRASNTWLLETSCDWTGLCVEPNPTFFRALVNARRCACLNACFYIRDGDVTFVDAGTLGGVLDLYPPAELQRLAKRLGYSPAIVRRPARTVRAALREVKAPNVIDYWSLDIEGGELALLKNFPFDEYTFRVLTVEHNYNFALREAIQALLRQSGFERLCTIAIDDCYVNSRLGLSTSMRRSRVFRRREN
jgi:hypothetical protein